MYLSNEEAKQKILHEKYGGNATPEYLHDCARIDAHEPWQYILGYSDFGDCTIDLSCRPMIPRDETAFWVRRVISEWSSRAEVRALDLYAGAGNIGTLLLKHLPEAHVVFSEVDAALLPGIKKTLALNELDPVRAELVAGDALQNVHGTFDIIAANPPYIHPNAAQSLDPEMYFEPHVAFFASDDGLQHTRLLIEEGKKFLTARGVIYCECDVEQVPILTQELQKTQWRWEFWKDEFGHDGVMVLRQ